MFLSICFLFSETFVGEDSENNEGEVNTVTLYMPLIRLRDQYLALLINNLVSDHVQI